MNNGQKNSVFRNIGKAAGMAGVAAAFAGRCLRCRRIGSRRAVDFGALMGLLIGGLQWFAARQQISLRQWMVANAIGWIPAMAIIMLAASSMNDAASIYSAAIFGAVAGAIAGSFVGLATCWTLPPTATANHLELQQEDNVHVI